MNPAHPQNDPRSSASPIDAPRFFFAGGGTGGHLYPGLAVAEALIERRPDARITFLTTDRPLDRELLARTRYAQVPQSVRPFTLHPLRVPGFLLAWRRSVAAARRRIRAERPQAVLGLGGYAAGPAVVAAWKEGVATAILNPDAAPGRANRWLAPRTKLVAAQFEASRRHFPPNVNFQTLGCPIRPAFRNAERSAGRRLFGVEEDNKSRLLLVTGASQGARTINRVMQRLWPAFLRTHPHWRLLHLTGPADEAETRAAYEAAAAPAIVLSFTHDMPLALAAADLVISRAGASTLAELTALGKPSILLPYPYHRDQHQRVNAMALVEAGAAELVEDARDVDRNEGPLRAALLRCADEDTRARMSAASMGLARPSAAAEIADWLLKTSPGTA